MVNAATVGFRGQEALFCFCAAILRSEREKIGKLKLRLFWSLQGVTAIIIDDGITMMARLPLLHILLIALRLSLCVAWSNPNSKTFATNPAPSSRRAFFYTALTAVCSTALLTTAPQPSLAKCTDIETCREIGDRKDAEDLAANPINRLGGGLQWKLLRPGFGQETVQENSKNIKIIYSISQANGSYMYSKGFGYNKIDINGKKVSDAGLDSLTVNMSDDDDKSVPVGIKRAMAGMKKGERRRIECPPKLGFETSDWNPKPTTFRGKQQMKDYKTTLAGRGSTQPAFPAPTIWDVEVISIR